MGPDEKLMMEKMGFSNFTAKWQTNLEEKEEVEVKEERHTFRFSFPTTGAQNTKQNKTISMRSAGARFVTWS